MAKKRRRQPPRKRSNRGERNLLLVCAWCKKEIQADDPVWAVTAKVRAGVELTPEEGPFVHMTLMTLPGKIVHGAVVTDDSEAKRQGWDMVFGTCSQECAEMLRDTLRKEVYFGEVLGLPGPA